MVSPSAARWRPFVEAELARAGVPIPASLILALIDVESGGSVGIVNGSSGASGLLQVLPSTLDDYNRNHAVKVTLDEMRSQGDVNAAKQLRVGIWVLSQFWKAAYRYLLKRLPTVPVDELAKIADLYYVAGPGATKKKLERLSSPTFDAVSAAFPAWSALNHARKVFSKLADIDPAPWSLDTMADWLHGALVVEKGKRPIDGFLLASIALLLAWWWLKRGNDGKDKKKPD